MQLWAGTSGFQYPEWKGNFYPEKFPASKMLSFYAERLNTTEVNYSFHRVPAPKTIANWAEATPANFKFTFKAPRKITHFARLRDDSDTLEYLLSILFELGEKLGVLLFQLPPDFTKDLPRLKAFLTRLPPGLRSAFEFRHPSWFDEEIFATLRARNAALCIAESERLATPLEPTADFGYLRLRRPDYTDADLTRWTDFVHTQKDRWRDTFVYFKHEEGGIGPKLAQQMTTKLRP